MAPARMDRAYRLALFCGATPLLVGLSIFFLWLFTHWQWLMIAGILTLAAGPVMFVFGLLNLAHFVGLARREPNLAPRRLRPAMFCSGSLLLANLPAAAGILAAVIAIETAYTVTVHNASGRPLEDVQVRGGGCDVFFGSIPPGGMARRSFWIRDDGELAFHATGGPVTYSVANISGYVTNGQGGQRTVTVNPDRSIIVTDEYGQPVAQEVPTP